VKLHSGVKQQAVEFAGSFVKIAFGSFAIAT
jgi:hypothetical protein